MTPAAFRCAAGACTTRRTGGCPQFTRHDEEVRLRVRHRAWQNRRGALPRSLARAGDRNVDAASPRLSARSVSTTFNSILFEKSEDCVEAGILDPPDFFVDLNLHQIVDAVTAGRDEYDLKPLFYMALKDIRAIQYRHEIMQDLENPVLHEHVNSFARRMRTMRGRIAQAEKLYYGYQKEAWFLDAVEIYCDAVHCLVRDLSAADPKSRGLLGLRQYLTNYAGREEFNSLVAETKKLKADLSAVQYCVHIKGSTVRVRKYQSEVDYSAEVEETFEKFKQGAVEDYKVKFSDAVDMNHVEAKILDFVAELYSDLFSSLDRYCAKNRDYLDRTVAAFDREIQFYLAYLEHAAKLKRAGLQFCYPQISDDCKEVRNCEGFDLALAHKLVGEKSSIVCNDFDLKGQERILVVSGPNQGGKTTFARTFGQLHYLASLGCPVPGKEARLFLFDNLFTHFEREEDIRTLRGKLEDDLVRVGDILRHATSGSIIIMNEIFTSTTLQDANFLGDKNMQRLVDLDALCVWVTFVDELAGFGERAVSMVSTVVRENPTLRTYKIVRRPADGLAYAMSIAEKYGLTYRRLRERVKP
jgi:DNA mismatch repair protein MutS